MDNLTPPLWGIFLSPSWRFSRRQTKEMSRAAVASREHNMSEEEVARLRIDFLRDFLSLIKARRLILQRNVDNRCAESGMQTGQ